MLNFQRPTDAEACLSARCGLGNISNTVQGIAAALYRNTLPHMSTVRGKTRVEKVKSLSKKPHIYETSQSLSLQFV